MTLNESNSIICKIFDVININETTNAIYIQIKDSKRRRRHCAYIYVLLHMFLLIQIHLNIFGSGCFFQQKRQRIVGKVAGTNNMYENLRESEMKVTPKKNAAWSLLLAAVTYTV